jgi:hypothetical protein
MYTFLTRFKVKDQRLLKFANNQQINQKREVVGFYMNNLNDIKRICFKCLKPMAVAYLEACFKTKASPILMQVTIIHHVDRI